MQPPKNYSPYHVQNLVQSGKTEEDIYQLGLDHEKGINGVPQSEHHARLYYLAAAQLRHVKAQYQLGLMLADGRGGPKEVTQGIIWLMRSAQEEHVDALFSLGMIYARARLNMDTIDNTTPQQNETTSIMYLERAAAKDHADSLNMLGMKYKEGNKFTPKNTAKAIEYFTRAASLGHPMAHNQLVAMGHPTPPVTPYYAPAAA